MKKLVVLLALLYLGTSCQPQTVPAAASVAAAPEAPTPQVAAPTLALLREHDMSTLLEGSAGHEVPQAEALDGFFGTNHYRLEMVLLHVQRDSLRPLRYQVQGKSRFKGSILPFEGTVTLTQLLEQPHYSAQEVAAGQQAGWKFFDADQELYTAVGRFELREKAGPRGAGVFRGHVAFDFGLAKNGSAEYSFRTSRTLAESSYLKYEGN